MSAAHILIVDDDVSVSTAVRRMLRSCDAEIAVENDSRLAVSRIRETPYDVVVCDVAMPAIDGWAVLRFIRDHYRGRTDAPDVIVTSGDDAATLPAGAVCAAILAKPFHAAEIRALVGQLIADRRARR